MRVKVIRHGADGYQLQRLDEQDKVLNVRPATVEEFRLYESLKQQSRTTASAYERQKAAEERAKAAEDALDRVREEALRVEQEHASRTIGKVLEDTNVIEEEADQQRARAEAAEAQLLIATADRDQANEAVKLIKEKYLALKEATTDGR